MSTRAALSTLAALLALLISAAVSATPLHALATAEDCGHCHVSPAGGGLRTPAGAAWAASALPTFLAEPTPARRTRTPLVSLGADAYGGGGRVTGAEPAALARAEVAAAIRPYNPTLHREGRLTLRATAAASTETPQVEVTDFGLIYDDLLFDTALEAGRFAPTLGPRFPGGAPFADAPWDTAARVTGAELTSRPGPLRLALGAYRPDTPWDAPWPADGGWGTHLELGLAGEVGRVALAGQTIGGGAPSRQTARVHGGLDLGRRWRVPLAYLGTYGAARGDGTHGALDAAHLVAWRIVRSLTLSLRYAWEDPDVELRYDSRHEAMAEVRWDAMRDLDLRLRALHRWQYPEDRFRTSNDTYMALLHGGF